MHKLEKKDRAELRNKYIGFVFQSYHLLDQVTVYENLEIPLSYCDVKKPTAKPWSATSWTDFRLSARRVATRASFRAASTRYRTTSARLSRSSYLNDLEGQLRLVSQIDTEPAPPSPYQIG